MPTIPPWHISPVAPEDDAKLTEIMEAYQERTGECPSKAGTIRRAVRHLWLTEVRTNED